MFTIKEASEKLNCPAHTIRFYDKEGLLPNIRRDDKGNRLFDKKDLDWIRLMTCFRATGMSIAGIREIVELAMQGEETIAQRRAILVAHQSEIVKKQQVLNEAFEAVSQKLEVYNNIQNGNPEDSFLEYIGKLDAPTNNEGFK
ncbi:DNA-binding transcriptional regulator, MerR family [Paenibacillus sp. 1_12]|uniref:MerR family transcriptional regulator n=1 Tax=Paenibacillus sp. 1_12 TaxID=1566278 RepID=UPI0008F3F97C|nr:MerR family transcriptional regulator [Paenibacillus sp. 1_12]SFM08922.1 DNA-binding transcriptional regulator, MerR family [Paenibacillus sp. 1_12]